MTITEDEISIIQTYYSNYGAKKCQDYIPRLTTQNIRQIAFKHGIKINPEVHNKLKSHGFDTHRKYTVNEEQFISPSTPEVAYLLGLMWADAYVPINGHRIKFESSTNDMHDITNVFNHCGNWRIKTLPEPHITQIQCFNSRLCKYLHSLDYHIKSGASAKKVLQSIPDILKHYWWRGYFDGDGWIDKTHNHHTIGFASVYDQNWDFISTLHPQFQIKRRIQKSGSRHSCALLHSKTEVPRVLSYIYQNYEIDMIGFSRKYNTFKTKYLS